jgi:hypothetical protein
MNRMLVLATVAGFATISISAKPFAQVPKGAITLAEVAERVAQSTNWEQFQHLVSKTPRGSIFLPSTLETGWKNPTFHLIIFQEVWSNNPGQLRNLLGIDEATAHYLIDLTATQLEIAHTRQALTGIDQNAFRRLIGEIPPALLEAFRERGVLGGPTEPLVIPIEDSADFVKQYQHARKTRPTHGCDVELCFKSDLTASYSIACKNAVKVTFTSGGKASFSLAAKSVDGTRSVNVSFSVNKQ